MSAVRELSGGTNIIYKVLWLMEEGRGEKWLPTVGSDGSSILTPKKHSLELTVRSRGRQEEGGMMTHGVSKCGRKNQDFVGKGMGHRCQSNPQGEFLSVGLGVLCAILDGGAPREMFAHLSSLLHDSSKSESWGRRGDLGILSWK